MSNDCLNTTSAPTATVLGPDQKTFWWEAICFHLNKTTKNQPKWVEAIGHSLPTKIDISSLLSGASFKVFKILF